MLRNFWIDLSVTIFHNFDFFSKNIEICLSIRRNNPFLFEGWFLKQKTYIDKGFWC